MRHIMRLVLSGLKWLIIGVVAVEVFSFLIIIGSNYWIYGQVRDGDPVRYDPYALFVGENAPRPTTHNPPEPDKRGYRRIWCFGGSTMKGATDDDDKTIPSFLARDLNESEPRLPAYVINFGEPSFNSLMEAKYLEKALIEQPTPPDLIIFYDGANDCAYFAQSRNPDAHHGYSQLRGLIESYHHSFFGLLKPLNAAMYASFTKELYDKIRQGVLSIEPDDPQLRKFVDTAEKRYDYLEKAARGAGAQFLLFWQPFWWVESGQVADAVKKQEDIVVNKHMALRHNFVVTNRALVARLKDKPYFIDFRNVLCGRTQPAYQDDGIHLRDCGREVVAGQMARVLKAPQHYGSARGGSLQ
jgi:hypothetical protein